MPSSTFFNFFLTITSEMNEQSFVVASFRGSRATVGSDTQSVIPREQSDRGNLIPRASFRGSRATVGISCRDNSRDCHEPDGSRNDGVEERHSEGAERP